MKNKIEEVIVGVWKVDSGKEGPVMAVVAGIHGDELAGVGAVFALKEQVECGELQIECGQLYLALGNIRATIERKRFSKRGTDLNRCFTPKILNGVGGTYEHGRARALAKVLASVTVGIDVHATFLPSVPFVYCQRTPTEADKRVIRWFQAPYVVTDPELTFADGQKVTLDEYFARNGGVGICYETGHAADTSQLTEVTRELHNAIIDHLGGSKKRYQGGWTSDRPTLCVLEHPFILPKTVNLSRWDWREKMENFARLFSLAIPNMFRSPEAERRAMERDHKARKDWCWSGNHHHVIIFPKRRDRWVAGEPVAYQARLQKTWW